MNTANCLQELTDSGHIARDARVVSTNNKVVVLSESEQVVSRICDTTELSERDDPHDLRYSHHASWLASDHAPVVRPLGPEPIITGSYLISSYPLLREAGTLHTADAPELFSLVQFFGNALTAVDRGMALRELNVGAYVEERLTSMESQSHPSPRLLDYVRTATDQMHTLYPFDELVSADTALIHGDFKTDNLVRDSNGNIKVIDLDAVAVGPRLYDIASWRLRAALGDKAPVEAMADAGRRSITWNEEAYRSLIGWKAISSMSFTLQYETPSIHTEKTIDIAHQAALLGGLAVLPDHLSV